MLNFSIKCVFSHILQRKISFNFGQECHFVNSYNSVYISLVSHVFTPYSTRYNHLKDRRKIDILKLTKDVHVCEFVLRMHHRWCHKWSIIATTWDEHFTNTWRHKRSMQSDDKRQTSVKTVEMLHDWSDFCVSINNIVQQWKLFTMTSFNLALMRHCSCVISKPQHYICRIKIND